MINRLIVLRKIILIIVRIRWNKQIYFLDNLSVPVQVAFRATSFLSQTKSHPQYAVSNRCPTSLTIANNQAQPQTFIQDVPGSISDGTMTTLIMVFRGLLCSAQLLNTGKDILVHNYAIFHKDVEATGGQALPSKC
jgi:hypothetical protein